jgi:hypothetical protein
LLEQVISDKIILFPGRPAFQARLAHRAANG